MTPSPRFFLAAAVLCFACVNPRASSRAQEDPTDTRSRSGSRSLEHSSSELRGLVERYVEDKGNVDRFYNVPMSDTDRSRKAAFFKHWQQRLQDLDFDNLGQDGRIDYLLLRSELKYRLGKLDQEAEQDSQVADLLPFAATIVEVDEARRLLKPLDARAVAGRLNALAGQVDKTYEDVKKTAADSSPGKMSWSRTAAQHAAGRVRALQHTLRRWYSFYSGYDPLFTWWLKRPYEDLNAGLGRYESFLSNQLAGKQNDRDKIVGAPIGREALLADLAHEMIPYTPEELVAIAEREFAWCDREMAKAAKELGFGDDWRKAQEHVKSLHVDPGEQPKLIAELATEAVDFLEARRLVTIPELCKETWRMRMMSAARQRVNPYFTGGEVISVSYPTAEMSHEDKLMSMRGNNIHFSRATVHHELIPGHHLQGFMTSRYRRHRSLFRTPFWTEGWALYWEMLLWDLDFPRSAEDRVGMLFWRKHRCARIIFSLGFHLGTMTPQEATDFLVRRVGHERRNATAEVRRSVQGGYSPLYQSAYMLGGLQIRSLHRTLVGSGTMTDVAFHDAVLRQNAIPIEMIRAHLTKQELTRDFESSWRFADR